MNRIKSTHAKLKRQLRLSKGDFESSWTSIHMLPELQHISIKTSLKKSKTVIQHNFKPSEFNELRGNIFIKSMEIVLFEVKQTNFVGVDLVVCGCVSVHIFVGLLIVESSYSTYSDELVSVSRSHCSWMRDSSN